MGVTINSSHPLCVRAAREEGERLEVTIATGMGNGKGVREVGRKGGREKVRVE